MFSYSTRDVAATAAFGRRLATLLTDGDVLCLSGDLGAGKTALAKGVAAGLGVAEEVTSPTFTILQVYESGRLPVYHFDLYRLESPEELWNIGFDEYAGKGVTVIEWADKFAAAMPEERLWLEMRTGAAGERLITLSPAGARHRKLCEELMKHADTCD